VIIAAPGYSGILATWDSQFGYVGVFASDAVTSVLAVSPPFDTFPCPSFECPQILTEALSSSSVRSTFTVDASSNAHFSQIVNLLNVSNAVLFAVPPSSGYCGVDVDSAFGLEDTLFQGDTITGLVWTITSTNFDPNPFSSLGNRLFDFKLDVIGTGATPAQAIPEPSTLLLVSVTAGTPFLKRKRSSGACSPTGSCRRTITTRWLGWLIRGHGKN
jgi:hypothetical protein